MGGRDRRRRSHYPPVLLLLILIAAAVVSATNGGGQRKLESEVLMMPRPKSLQVNAESKFRIALFADLHYGEDAWTDWGPEQDSNSDLVMAAVLDAEKPDFVIYLGDVITANSVPIANASLYWDRALSPTRSRGIPWASLFGNHDDMPFEWPSEWFSSSGIPQIVCPHANLSFSGQECAFKGTTRMELMIREISYNMLSHSAYGPKELWPSVSNYILQIVSSKDPKATVAFLYFLDSGGGSYPEVISNSQARWFQKQSQKLNPDSTIPEIIFWHIPSIAYKSVAPSRIFGIRKPCIGSINKERVAAQEAEQGIMDFVSNRLSVKLIFLRDVWSATYFGHASLAIFVGHNHGLDWCCPSKKLWLCFARHTGYGGYGNWPRGSRIIEITEQPFSLKSWIRMEDGSTHSDVKLS